VIGEVGYVARNMKVSNILASQGWKSFNQHQTAAILEQILLTNPVQSIALDADWPTVAKFYPMALESPRFSHLVLEAMDAKSGAGGPASSLRQALLDAPPEKRDVLLRDQLHEQVARIIGTSSKKIDVQDPISTMGLDSLMANQLRNWIQQNLQLDFSLMRVMRGPSIQELTGMLAEDLQAQESGAAPAEGVGELDKWVLRNKPVPDAKIRLFCFPYMAGGASVFFDWAEFLPRNIEVCSIQMPGREERSGEEPFQDIDPLVEKVADLILPLLDKPFAFYGHSFGAGIGFKLSHYLFTKHGLLPEHLFIGAWLAPHLHNPFRILDRIKAKDFTTIPESLIFEHLRGLEMPESVLSNADLMNEMMPSIRADMMMGKRYTHSEDTPLACRITAFAGSEDSVFSVEQVSAWSKHSSDGFQLEVIPGGHLFLNENKETLLKIMSEILSPQKP
jgi:surfactin synthase thioesterase subunit/aryl carrier-like protein